MRLTGRNTGRTDKYPDVLKYAQTYCCRRHMYRNVFPKHGIGAEVGVRYGKNAKELFEETSPRQFHLIDIWKNPDIYRKAKSHLNHPRMFFHTTKSLRAAKFFPDHYFDWVYVDANHEFESVMLDLWAYRSKIKPGGILAGHDFSRPAPLKTIQVIDWHFPGVKKSVRYMLNELELICFTEEDQRSFSMRVR